MYKVTINNNVNNYYNVTLMSEDCSHYINIYISNVDEGINVSISKSDDNFYFKSPFLDMLDLELNTSRNLEETFNYVKKYFIDKGYKFTAF